MYLHQIFRHLYQVACHRYWFLPSGIYFQRWDTLFPDVLSHINVLHRHYTIIDLIALYDPLVVFNLWVTNRCIHFPCLFSSLDIFYAVTFLVGCYCVDEHKVFILWVIVM